MIHFGLLLFPRLTQLDLTGPAQVFSRCPEARVDLIWKTTEPVPTGDGWSLVPNMTFADCPQLDVLCVPGGQGQTEQMDDEETLDFLRRQAVGARFVTSVCTGSLLLGAAGLLDGYRATCHWMSLDQLPLFGAVPVAERVVRDRNRITGGGVTAGIDFGLTVAAELHGAQIAQRIQLLLEYAPEPPYQSGTPTQAGPELVQESLQLAAANQARRREASQRAAERLKLRGELPSP
ncbi:thiamine biosynthesis protein ThiJ [bacterium SCN 62-11]|nr:DJ-1/PfpI family protein [Candidatus Eremiobacteraeota bacterium]ODT57128.1 MAG: thiamine biosynthesis protein ThiJ [bacterium SCN 62-11]